MAGGAERVAVGPGRAEALRAAATDHVAVFVAVAWLGVAFTRGLVAGVFAAWFSVVIVLGRRRAAQLSALWRERRRTIVLAVALSTGTFLAAVLKVPGGEEGIGAVVRGIQLDVHHGVRG